MSFYWIAHLNSILKLSLSVKFLLLLHEYITYKISIDITPVHYTHKIMLKFFTNQILKLRFT